MKRVLDAPPSGSSPSGTAVDELPPDKSRAIRSRMFQRPPLDINHTKQHVHQQRCWAPTCNRGSFLKAIVPSRQIALLFRLELRGFASLPLGLPHDDLMQVQKPSREATSHSPPAPAEGAGPRGSASPRTPPVLALFVKVVFNQFRGTNFVPGSGCDQTVSIHPDPSDLYP